MDYCSSDEDAEEDENIVLTRAFLSEEISLTPLKVSAENVKNDCRRQYEGKKSRKNSCDILDSDGNLTVNRPVLTVPQKHQEFHYSKPEKQGVIDKVTQSLKEEFTCSSQKLKKFLFLRLPILEWLLHYNVKEGLLGDVISGITVAIMHIPQGMAYALLANLDPISGIYMAFFPVLVYAFFASSRHLSMGTFAVICLMTGKVVSELAYIPEEVVPEPGLTTPDYSMTTMNPVNETGLYTPTEVSTIVCFGVAIWMMIFGFLNLGSLSVFLSDMLVSGFTTGAAVHVFTSQVKSLFGVTIKSYNGTFKVILTWGAIFKNILDSNPATMVISMICIIIILINNELIKPRLRKITMIPIPIELIVVVGGTLASRYGHLDENYDVVIVGPIPTGLPPPTLPPFELLGQVIIPCLIISIVSYSISFSMAKIFAQKKDYLIDATQEMYANGLGNLVGCLFKCAPISGSLSRSLIQVSVGGYSQLTSFISCGIVLLVLLFIGPFFSALPNCVLAAIIVTALKGMFLQFGDFKRMLKVSRVDAGLWMVTFLGVVIIDIDYGLFIGIICSVILLLHRNQTPSVVLLGRASNSDMYLDKERYASVSEISNMKLCAVTGSLHYANNDSLRSSIIETSGLDPRDILKKRKKALKKLEKDNVTLGKGSLDKSVNEIAARINGHRNSNASIDLHATDVEKRIKSLKEPQSEILVLDFSGVSQMDIASAKNIGVIYSDFRAARVSIYFAAVPEKCLETLAKCGTLKDVPEDRFFHSTHDVVTYLTSTKMTDKNFPNKY